MVHRSWMWQSLAFVLEVVRWLITKLYYEIIFISFFHFANMADKQRKTFFFFFKFFNIVWLSQNRPVPLQAPLYPRGDKTCTNTQYWRWQAMLLASPSLPQLNRLSLPYSSLALGSYFMVITWQGDKLQRTSHGTSFYSIVCPERSQNYKLLELCFLPQGNVAAGVAVRPNSPAPGNYWGLHTDGGTEACQVHETVFVAIVLLVLQVGLILFFGFFFCFTSDINELEE